MAVYYGIGIGRGLAVGPVRRMAPPLAPPSEDPRTGEAEPELAAVDAAVAAVAADLEARGARLGGETAAVLEAQALMAKDPALRELVAARVEAGATGERAVHEAFEEFRAMLAEIGGYLGERAADLADVAQRVIARLRGVPVPGVPQSEEPFILVADDLAPADTAMLDLDVVLGLITRDGGPTSHTAILARSRSIPAIVGVREAGALEDGVRIILDARMGEVVTDPDVAAVARAQDRIAARAAAAGAPSGPGRLADGLAVPLYANVGKPADAAAAVEHGAEGVGLFRTEFLFLDAQRPPSIDEQVRTYREVFAAFPGKKVVARCLDAGADKPLAFLNADREENPALGLRGLRALRAHEGVLRDQLAALARAAADTTADVWVMAPMVADLEETEYFVRVARDLGLKTVGVMAEIPSLALEADRVLPACDFVSIGTNDLTQYTLAADRLLGTVAQYQDPWHPAVLRLVGMLGRAGAATGTPVGVCGEAAADPELAVVLVGLGATSLSMTPAALAEVRAELGRTTKAQAVAAAEAALGAASARAAKDAAAAAVAAHRAEAPSTDSTTRRHP